MKYGIKEIKELTDDELNSAYHDCLAQEKRRAEVANHSKFDKSNPKNVGSLPAPNPAFVELKNALKQELDNRWKAI